MLKQMSRNTRNDGVPLPLQGVAAPCGMAAFLAMIFVVMLGISLFGGSKFGKTLPEKLFAMSWEKVSELTVKDIRDTRYGLFVLITVFSCAILRDLGLMAVEAGLSLSLCLGLYAVIICVISQAFCLWFSRMMGESLGKRFLFSVSVMIFLLIIPSLVSAFGQSKTLQSGSVAAMPDDADLPEVELKFCSGESFGYSSQFDKNLRKDGILLWTGD